MKYLFLNEVISEKITGDWGDEGVKVYVLRTTNFTNDGVIDFSNVVTRDIPEKVIERKKLVQGDVIIEKSGGSPSQPVGRVVYFESKDEVFLCNNFTAILRSNDLVYPKYLFYFLFSLHKLGVTLKFQNKTTGIINLQLDKYLDRIQIPIPPLPEQKRIANILNKAYSLRLKNKQLLAIYDELLQSTFLDMFGDPATNPKGWEKKEAERFIDLLTGYPFKSKEYSDSNDDLKLCGGLIIMPWGIEWGKSNHWRRDMAVGLEKYFLKENDIVMAMDRPWISSGFKIAQIKKEDIPTILVQRTARIRAKKINQMFLYYLYQSKGFEIHARPTETTVPHISPTDIKNYKLILPPITLQNQFAQIVENIEAQKALVKQSLQESEDLFNGLVQKAFGGEL